MRQTGAKRGEALTHFVAPPAVAPRKPRRRHAVTAAFGTLLLTAVCVSGAWLTGGEGDSPASTQLGEPIAFATLRGLQPATPTMPEAPARQAIERRLDELRRQQEELTTRQARLNAVLTEAKARGIDPAPLADDLRQALSARLSSRPVAAPRPILAKGEALSLQAPARTPASARADELDLALQVLAQTQDALLSALEQTTEDRLETLASIPEELGLRAPDISLGGPFIDLRGVEGGMTTEDRFEIVEAGLGQIDELEEIVAALPVRLPLKGRFAQTSAYGKRVDPFLGRPAMHTGIDFAAPSGTAVHAAGSGTVRFAAWNGGYGRMVEIDHGNGHRTRYAHLSSINVTKGDKIGAGDIIGAVGTSGRSTGPHLHYELMRDGRRRDPSAYVKVARAFAGRI
ncbi:Membrane protein [Lutibaculum baratangense AMV1]|uniref:Membrane protein n=1 Tax=Lutibaculum baratangense AMV1 TaxID=631454 RepID=V4TG27_9HYPH|nr:Membrane protein [Lutibaculum baratangense AMV1]